MPTSIQPRRRRRWLRWTMAAVGCAGAIAAAVLAFGWGETEMDRAARCVRAELPIGTHRKEIEEWINTHYGVLPTYYEDVNTNQICGKTIPERAGVPAHELGGMVFLTVRRRGRFAEVWDRIHYDHLWVYFLLDHEQRLRDYYFFSFDDLRNAERQRAAERG